MIISRFPTASRIYTDQVTSLAANYVDNTPGSLTVTWANPTSKKFVGTMIRYKAGSYPTSPTDGTQAYFGTGTSTTITGLTGGTTYYVRAFAKASNTAGTKIYYNTTGGQVTGRTATAPVTGLTASFVPDTSGQLTISWTAPTGVADFVYIVRRADRYPTAYNDGTVISTIPSATSVVDTGLAGNTQYYYAAFTAWSGGNWNTDAAQRVTKKTLCTPLTLSIGARTSNSIVVSWNASPDPNRAIYLVRKAGGYPANIADGTQIYVAWDKNAGSVTDIGLSPTTTYYYRAFVHNDDSVFNSNTSQQAMAATKLAAGQVIFTTSQTYTIPAGVTVADLFVVGGGGAGGLGNGSGGDYGAGAGGGGGYTATKLGQVVTPGAQHVVTVGAGGAYYSQGGSSSFGSLLTASGGKYGKNGTGGAPINNIGGAGGSGGGAGGFSGSSMIEGGAGGYDGGDGNRSMNVGTPYAYGGTGQGTTTKAFGEVGNTLYAGGGGGGTHTGDTVKAGGSGGGGNGGISSTTLPTVGTPNTGGGGGGYGTTSGGSAAIGGSGVVIIRWAEQ